MCLPEEVIILLRSKGCMRGSSLGKEEVVPGQMCRLGSKRGRGTFMAFESRK